MLLAISFFQLLHNYFSGIPGEWNDFTHNIPSYAPIIGVLILVESLLSVDNAAVLATMVMDLPEEQRKKALKYGIVGAYVFRGICLVMAGFLVTIWWLKPIGGLYLLYLFFQWLLKGKKAKTKKATRKEQSSVYRYTVGLLGPFWSVVAMVEVMDLAFSIDNVFAAVAFTPNIIPIWIGVFIGILAMRFVAQFFVHLMQRYTFLEGCAYLVIGILGGKLIGSVYTHFYPCSAITRFMDGEAECLKAHGRALPTAHEIAGGDILTSILTAGIFIVPILSSLLFNFPRRKTA